MRTDLLERQLEHLRERLATLRAAGTISWVEAAPVLELMDACLKELERREPPDDVITRTAEELPVALMVVDPQGLIQRANKRAAYELGMPRHSLVGWPLPSLVDARTRAGLCNALDQVSRRSHRATANVTWGHPIRNVPRTLELWRVGPDPDHNTQLAVLGS